MSSRRRALLAAIAIALAPTSVSAQSGKPARPPKGTPKPPAPPPVPPPTPEQEQAVKLFVEGRDLLAKKQYEQACAAFTQSQTLDPAVGTQLNLALCFEEWGRTASAYRAYVEAERLALEKQDDRAAAARQRITTVKVRVPQLRVTVPAEVPADARITVDAIPTTREQLAEELLLDPGRHAIVLAITGRESTTTEVELAEGEKKQVTLDVPPAPVTTQVITVTRTNSLKSFGGMAALAGGVGLIAYAGLGALAARSNYNSVGDRCLDGVCTDEGAVTITQAARSRANRMTIVGAGGLALVGVGVFLVLTRKETVEEIVEVRGVSITPVVGPELVGLAIGGAL